MVDDWIYNCRLNSTIIITFFSLFQLSEVSIGCNVCVCVREREREAMDLKCCPAAAAHSKKEKV